MQIYQIPMCTRHIDVGDGPINLKKTRCVCVNDRGVMVTYNDEMDINTDLLKSIKPVIRKSLQYFVAEGCVNAMIQVFLEYKGMVIGGSSEYSKAMWINTGFPIIEFPKCFFMHKNESGGFICGEPMPCRYRGEPGCIACDRLIPCGKGIFGWCFAEDPRGASYCPIVRYEAEILNNYKKYINSAEEVSYKKVKYRLITPESIGYNQYRFPKTQFIRDEYIPINIQNIVYRDK